MSTRKEQKEKRQEEILIAALGLFIKKGYASTTTSEIAKTVKISEGLLFHYFKTKEILYETLIDLAMSESRAWIDLESVEPISYFVQVATTVLECMRQDNIGAQFFVLVAQSQQSEGIPKRIADKIEAAEQRANEITAIVKRGQAEGSIREGDPLALTYLFSCTLQGIALQHARHPATPFPQADWIVDLLRAKP